MLVLILASLETITRFGFRRLSGMESRIATDHSNALTIRRGLPPSSTMLLVGNSLLLNGLDPDRFRAAMEPKVKPVRFVIEGTAYLEWYYGLRRLFDEGSRPDRVVLCMSMHQLLGNSTRGDYSAFYLFQTRDLLSVGRDTGLDLTGISSLFFSRYSLFYAGRTGLRNYILNTIDPAYAKVLKDIASGQADSLSDAQVLAGAPQRLIRLRMLCAQYNASFDFLLPPGFGTGSGGLVEAGRRTGTSVLIPVPQNSWKSDMFLPDNYHLNQKGAVRFTESLISAFSRAGLTESSPAP